METKKKCPSCGWKLNFHHGSENDPWKHSSYYIRGSYYFCTHCGGIFTVKK